MKENKGCMEKGIQAAIGVLLFTGTAFAYEDPGFAKKSAGLAGLFDKGAAVETQVFSPETGAAEEIKAQALIQVMAAIYVPVLPEGQEKTLGNRVAGLGLRHGFILDKGFEPVQAQDSREPGRIWQGISVFLVRGWVQESKLAGLTADPVVQSVQALGAWSPRDIREGDTVITEDNIVGIVRTVFEDGRVVIWHDGWGGGNDKVVKGVVKSVDCLGTVCAGDKVIDRNNTVGTAKTLFEDGRVEIRYDTRLGLQDKIVEGVSKARD